jgi:hypothetical protein
MLNSTRASRDKKISSIFLVLSKKLAGTETKNLSLRLKSSNAMMKSPLCAAVQVTGLVGQGAPVDNG